MNIADEFYLILFSVVIFVIYYPAKNLFFRLDEWYNMPKIFSYLNSKKMSRKIRLLFFDVWEGNKIYHIHPISLASLFYKFKLFRTNFPMHFFVSLLFHLLNYFLIYYVTLKITGNSYIAFCAAVMFGSCSLHSDAIFMPGYLAFVLVTTLTLLSLLFHSSFDSSGEFNVLFILANLLSPLVFELGLVTPILSLFILIIYDKFNLYIYASLIIIILIPFLLRFLCNDKKHVKESMKKRSLSGIILISIEGLFKTIIGIFGCSFDIVVADHIYIKQPMKKIHNFLPVIFFIITMICMFLFFIDKRVIFELKLFLLILTCIATIPFIMVYMYYPIKELSYIKELDKIAVELSRYYYLPIALITIVLAIVLFNSLERFWFLLLVIISSLISLLQIRKSYKLILPHTNDIKLRVAKFIDTGIFHYKNLTRIYDFKLDWSLGKDTISAFYKIKMMGKIDFDPKTQNELGERLFKEGKIEEAKRAFVNAIVLDPDFIPAYSNLGVLYYSQKDYNDASQYFIEGLLKDFKDKDLLVNFASLLCNMPQIDIPSNIRQICSKEDLTNDEFQTLRLFLSKFLTNLPKVFPIKQIGLTNGN